MTLSVTIKELSVHEVERFLAEKRFARFKPETCSQCEATTGFTRRIFHVTGVPKSKYADEATQQWMRWHFQHHYAIATIFFKTHGQRFFIDSAACERCASTAIIYDIAFDQELITELAKETGQPVTHIKSALERAYATLRKKE
jgi:hypothetical protein